MQDLPVVVDDDYDEGPIRDDTDEAGANLDAATGDDGMPFPEGVTPLENPAAADAGVAAAKGLSCVVCEEKAQQRWLACTCGARAHVACLAQHYIQAQHLHYLVHIIFLEIKCLTDNCSVCCSRIRLLKQPSLLCLCKSCGRHPLSHDSLENLCNRLRDITFGKSGNVLVAMLDVQRTRHI